MSLYLRFFPTLLLVQIYSILCTKASSQLPHHFDMYVLKMSSLKAPLLCCEGFGGWKKASEAGCVVENSQQAPLQHTLTSSSSLEIYAIHSSLYSAALEAFFHGQLSHTPYITRCSDAEHTICPAYHLSWTCGLIALTLSSSQWAICKSFRSQHLHLVGLVLIGCFFFPEKIHSSVLYTFLTFGRRFSDTGHKPCFVVVCMNCVWFMACHAHANDIRSLRYLPCSSLRQLLMRRSPPFPSLSQRVVIGGCQSGSLRGCAAGEAAGRHSACYGRWVKRKWGRM